MSENCYEDYRTILTFNLSNVIHDSETLKNILDTIDYTMNNYDISRKQMDIISAAGFPDVAKYYLASRGIANLSKKTLKQYMYKLKNFFDTVNKSFADITTNDIRSYLFRYKNEHNVSDRYIDNIRITLNSFFNWLVYNDYIQKNPCAKVDKTKYKEKIVKPLSTFNLEDLRWHCNNVREKALIDFIFSTGCRVSECASVMLSDINWENNSVHLRHCKGDKERIVFFNDESKVSLRAYLETRGHESHALWTSTRKPHQQLKEHALENIVRKVGERAGLNVFPHKLRHTFATVGINSGMPIEMLKELLGHKSLQTTLIYAKQNREMIEMEHRKTFL